MHIAISLERKTNESFILESLVLLIETVQEKRISGARAEKDADTSTCASERASEQCIFLPRSAVLGKELSA